MQQFSSLCPLCGVLITITHCIFLLVEILGLLCAWFAVVVLFSAHSLSFSGATSMKDLFDKTDNQLIVDFIKDINFYHSL